MSELMLENREVQLTQRQIDRLFADIGLRTQYLSDNTANAGCLLLARAVDFALLQDFTNAESDLNQAVQVELPCTGKGTLSGDKASRAGDRP